MKLPPSKAKSGRYYHSAVETDRIHDFRCKLWLDYANKLPRRMRLRNLARAKAEARADMIKLIVGGLLLWAMAAAITFLLFSL
jgi:hypothetical protein